MKVKSRKELHEVVCGIGYCEVCKIDYQLNMLCPHHILSKGSRPDLILETTNCISVCNTPSSKNKQAGCHNAIHDGLIKI